jgi:PmbA protein
MDKKHNKCKTLVKKELESLAEIAGQVLALAKQKGATDAEVALSTDKGLSVTTRLLEVETLEFNKDKGVGLTVYLGHRRGSVSSSDTSKKALEEAVTHAIEIAKVSDEDPCFGLADKSLLSQDYPELDLYHPWDVDAEEAIKIAKECEEIALNTDKRIVNSEGVSVGSYQFLRVYGNTNGFLGAYSTTRHTKSCVLLAEDANGMQRDYDYTTARRSEALYNAEVLAKKAVEKTIKRLDAKTVATQKVPVIFSNDVSSSLLSALISAISGGSIYRRASFLLDKIGEPLLPSRYNVFEEPHKKGALGSAPYDGEGIITRNNAFVEDGILKSYVLGSYSARRLGLETTANSGGVHNLTINNDGVTFDALLKKMDKGVLITELMGQGINLVTGDYSRGVSGFWVENGKIQYPVDGITVAGNLSDMFKGIQAIANDEDVRKATRCGSVLINQMTIAGS